MEIQVQQPHTLLQFVEALISDIDFYVENYHMQDLKTPLENIDGKHDSIFPEKNAGLT